MQPRQTPTITQSVEDYIIGKVQAGTCLCCKNRSLKRGLCYSCYYQWTQARLRLPKNKREQFDAALQADGRLLDSQQVRRYRRINVFTKTANSISRREP